MQTLSHCNLRHVVEIISQKLIVGLIAAITVGLDLFQRWVLYLALRLVDKDILSIFGQLLRCALTLIMHVSVLCTGCSDALLVIPPVTHLCGEASAGTGLINTAYLLFIICLIEKGGQHIGLLLIL